MLLFGGGSALVIGLLGGIAAIAGGIKLADLAMDDFTKTNDGFAKKMDEATGAIGRHRIALYGLERQMLDLRERALEEQQTAAAEGTGALGKGKFPTSFGEFFRQLFGPRPEVQAILDQTAATTALNAVNRERAKIDEEIRALQERRTEAQNRETEATERMQEAVARLAAEQPKITAIIQKFLDLANAPEAGDFPAIFLEKGWIEHLIHVQHQLEEQGKRINEAMVRIGQEAIRSLLEGFFKGSIDFGDILKNIIISLIELKVKGPLMALLGIASPSTVGIQVGQALVQGIGVGVSGGVVGPAQFRLNLPAGLVPPAVDPISAARDGMWQQLWRESSLVAESGGFRLKSG